MVIFFGGGGGGKRIHGHYFEESNFQGFIWVLKKIQQILLTEHYTKKNWHKNIASKEINDSVIENCCETQFSWKYNYI